jgi:hypothetical protein
MLEKILPRNESTVDRAIRVTAGLGLLSLTVVGPQTLLGLFGIIPLVTGLVGSCPLYRILGISTCTAEEAG